MHVIFITISSSFLYRVFLNTSIPPPPFLSFLPIFSCHCLSIILSVFISLNFCVYEYYVFNLLYLKLFHTNKHMAPRPPCQYIHLQSHIQIHGHLGQHFPLNTCTCICPPSFPVTIFLFYHLSVFISLTFCVY